MGEVGVRERAGRGRSSTGGAILALVIAEMLIIGYPARTAARIPYALECPQDRRHHAPLLRLAIGALLDDASGNTAVWIIGETRINCDGRSGRTVIGDHLSSPTPGWQELEWT